AVLIADTGTTVWIGEGGDVTTLVGPGTHELSRPPGRYPLTVTRGGTSQVKSVEIVPEKRVEVPAGKREMVESGLTRAIPVFDPGGHHRPVRALVFTPGGDR